MTLFSVEKFEITLLERVNAGGWNFIKFHYQANL